MWLNWCHTLDRRALVAAAHDHRAVLTDRDRQVLDAAFAALSKKGLFDPRAWRSPRRSWRRWRWRSRGPGAGQAATRT